MSQKHRRPSVAAPLSLIAPGFGHLYAGDARKAIFIGLSWALGGGLLAMSPLPKSFIGFLIFIAILLAAMVVAAVSAARTARRNADQPRKLIERGLVCLVLGLIFSLLLHFTAGEIGSVKAYVLASGTMEPVLFQGEKIYTEQNAYEDRLPDRGDIVIYERSSDNGPVEVAGRVVGLPGETLSIRDKVVYINNQKLDDPWGVFRDSKIFPDRRFINRQARLRDQLAGTVIPDGAVFLMGDDRDYSFDSRFLGAVPLDRVHHRALYIYWSRDLGRLGTKLASERPDS